MMYKTSDKDHKPSAGVLYDLIKKYGPRSEEVQSYLTSFADDANFQKKAQMMLGYAGMFKGDEGLSPELGSNEEKEVLDSLLKTYGPKEEGKE